MALRLGIGVAGRDAGRDEFLLASLQAGATHAVWIDLGRGWAEQYGRCSEGRFTQRRLLWSGDRCLLEAGGAAGATVVGRDVLSGPLRDRWKDRRPRRRRRRPRRRRPRPRARR